MAQARWTTSYFRFVKIASNNIKKFNLLNSFKNLDYTCCPDEEKPEEFWAYLADRKYDLIPGDDYLQKIKSKSQKSFLRQGSIVRVVVRSVDLGDDFLKAILDAGFADAVRDDMSDWFVEILNMEIEKLRSMKDEFLEHHSMQDYLDLENGWLDKVQRVQSGVQSVSFVPNILGDHS